MKKLYISQLLILQFPVIILGEIGCLFSENSDFSSFILKDSSL